MIIHTSIPSTRPEQIAGFLARLIDGVAIPFPPVPGAWVTIPGDGSGQTIEVYPLGTVGLPGKGAVDPAVEVPFPRTKPWELQLSHDPRQAMESGHHLALGTRRTREEVLRLGEEMGFRTIACERAGIFELIEVWIENRFLVEVITEPEQKRYRAFWSGVLERRQFAPARRP